MSSLVHVRFPVAMIFMLPPLAGCLQPVHLPNESLLWSLVATASNDRRIFLTASALPVNGGITLAGADVRCNGDANKPAGPGTYRAMLAAPGRQRPTTDLPLLPSHSYFRVGFTAKILDIDGSGNPTIFNSIDGTATQYWTGLSATYSMGGNHCLGWTDGTSAPQG